jgi:hypothetical protein
VEQHDALARLNVQTHASAQTASDDYVLSAFLTFDKLPTLLHDLLLSEAWRDNVLPLLAPALAERAGTTTMRAYFVLHHEEVVFNMLESFLYHDYAAEALGDALIDLVDYCTRAVAHLIALNNAVLAGSASVEGMWEGGSGSSAELEGTAAAARQLRTWANQAVFRLGVTAVCILRYLSDYAVRLPLSIMTRLLDTHDVALLMVPLLENPPWVRKVQRQAAVAQAAGEGGVATAASGAAKTVWQKYVDHAWTDVDARDLLRMTKLEGQPWLTLHALLLEPDCRRRYALTSHRRATLARVRKYLNEVLTDQLPLLPDLQRMLDETAVMRDGAETAESSGSRAFLVESTPAVYEAVHREALQDEEGGRRTWEQVATAVLGAAFRPRARRTIKAVAPSSTWPDSDDDGDILRLGEMYTSEAFDEAGLDPPKCAKCGEPATKRCSRCANEWYCSRPCQVAAWAGHKVVCDVVAAHG